MYTIKTNDLGTVNVDKEVVQSIAGLAAMDCYGLVGMVAQDFHSGLENEEDKQKANADTILVAGWINLNPAFLYESGSN